MKYIKDLRTGNTYPIRPTIRNDNKVLNMVVAMDSNPEGFEVIGWIPRNRAKIVDKPMKGK